MDGHRLKILRRLIVLFVAIADVACSVRHHHYAQVRVYKELALPTQLPFGNDGAFLESPYIVPESIPETATRG